jgi:hypothetical protein
MKTSTLMACSVYVLCALACGCATTEKVATVDGLSKAVGQGPLRVLTVDSVLYTLESFSFDDSLLSGVGNAERGGIETRFEGSLPFPRIVFIERMSTSNWKGAAMIYVSGLTLALVVAAAVSTPTFEIRPRYGGSCPFVYAFDGTRQVLEAEAFGTSLSRAFEAETYSVLPSLREVNGSLTVRFSNEREETHLLNRVRLYAADLGDAASAALDVDNRLWPMRDPRPPVSARDHSGRDILARLARVDTVYWDSDLVHATSGSGFRDRMELDFAVPGGTHEATLVVRGVNTELVNLVYGSAGAVLGNAVMQFYHAMENDPSLQHSIGEWLHECGLRVEIDEGGGYREACVMLPEANVAPFSRAVRLTGLSGRSGALRVRLTTLTGVWRIDAVHVDASPAEPLVLREMPMRSAVASDGRDAAAEVCASDSSYALLLPPQRIDLTFDAASEATMGRPVHVVAARGYLYEWFSRDAEGSPFEAPQGMSGENRIALLKALIGQKDIFLPPLYARWRKETSAR